jgi:DNA-binding response OmpR family regulator
MPKKILVIDDNPDMVEMIRMRLESKGYAVIGAFDGEDGLAKAKSTLPDLIMLDILMPVMDGRTFLIKMQEDKHMSAIPVIILTGHQNLLKIIDVQKPFEHILKPFSAMELLQKVRKQIGESEAKTVLVIDDEPDIVNMLKMRLEANRYDCLTASNGQEGLMQLKKKKVDLILLDILMPVMDGYEFFKRVKKDEKTKDIPIIVLTARGMMRDTFDFLGVDDFLPKPFDGNQVVERIDFILKEKALVLCNNEDVSSLVTTTLWERKFEMHKMKHEEDFWEKIKEVKYAVVVIFIPLVKKKPAEFIANIREGKNKNSIVILYSNSLVPGTEKGNVSVIRALRDKWLDAGADAFFDLRIAENDFATMLDQLYWNKARRSEEL